MRRRTLAVLGAGLASVLAGGTVLAAPTLYPPAAAGELPAFTDCEELLAWYVDSTLPMVGPWGLDPPAYYAMRDQQSMLTTAAEGSAPGPDEAVGSGETGTNVQEAGVDEPDVAKTDGTIVVHIANGGSRTWSRQARPAGGRDVVVTDVTGSPRELSRVPLAGRLGNAELLLVGDKVVVLGDDSYYGGMPDPMESRLMAPEFSPGQGRTSVMVIDITDPVAPRIESRQRYDGGLVSAREYDGTLRMVLTTSRPTIDFVVPNRDRTPGQARLENRRILRNSTIEDWLPSVTSGLPGSSGSSGSSGAERSPLLECEDVRHPGKQSGLGTISVVTFDADSPADRSATAVTAAGELVYSSTDRLYLATTAGGGWGEPVPLADDSVQAVQQPPRTQVHAFALDGTDTTYVASGEIPGWVKDRWSLSEHDGHLRVATALGQDMWNPAENAVVVFEERGDDLVEVGRVAKLGIDEQIQSVRWFGDLAIVVTFRQVDPLYTIDLSDPTQPEVLGELKIPGFSAYLHPVGDDRLLGLGQNATLTGSMLGAQAAVFDISNLEDPKRVGATGFNRDTMLSATSDPRAFTYLPEQRTALSPVQDYGTGRTRLAILRVAADGTITRTTTGQIADWDASGVRTLPLGNGQVALVAGGKVTKLSV